MKRIDSIINTAIFISRFRRLKIISKVEKCNVIYIKTYMTEKL